VKLDEFIKQTLLEITKGVTEAQEASLLHIAPGTVENEIVKTPSTVNFEVVVTVNKEAGGGISVWSMGDLKAGAASERTNRISFDVPVYFQAPTERNPKHFTRKRDDEE
jgi:hypothetical protein